jgi:hypothetical protein
MTVSSGGEALPSTPTQSSSPRRPPRDSILRPMDVRALLPKQRLRRVSAEAEIPRRPLSRPLGSRPPDSLRRSRGRRLRPFPTGRKCVALDRIRLDVVRVPLSPNAMGRSNSPILNSRVFPAGERGVRLADVRRIDADAYQRSVRPFPYESAPEALRTLLARVPESTRHLGAGSRARPRGAGNLSASTRKARSRCLAPRG